MKMMVTGMHTGIGILKIRLMASYRVLRSKSFRWRRRE